MLMKYKVNISVGGAMALLAMAAGVSAYAYADTTPKSGEFDQISTVTMERVTLKTTDHVTFQGDRYRFESVDMDDGYTPYSDIYDGQSIYHFIPSLNTAMRFPLQTKPESTLDSLRDQTAQKIEGTAKTGETTVDGMDCDVYSRDLGSGSKVLLYLSKDPKFPYIVKTMLTVPAEGITRTNSIENVKLDVPVGADEFTLPTGTKIVERPAAGGQPGASGSTSAAPQTDPPNSGTAGTESK